MEGFFIAFRALIYGTCFVLLWGWIALKVRVFDRILGIVLPPWTETLGIIIMVLGGILVLTCVEVFATSGRGTPAPFDPPKELVPLGPYKYVRNPMYLGGLTLLIGFGVYHHSLWILLLSPLLFSVLHLFVLLVEEPGLEKRFGQSYRQYKSSINRWAPKWKPINDPSTAQKD